MLVENMLLEIFCEEQYDLRNKSKIKACHVENAQKEKYNVQNIHIFHLMAADRAFTTLIHTKAMCSKLVTALVHELNRMSALLQTSHYLY